MASAADFARLSRPRDWVKNLLILAPVPFALAAGASLHAPALALGFAAFCLANSAAFAFNDALDAEADRLHPRRRARPVAAGRISRRAALLFSAALAALALALAAASRSVGALASIATYLALTVAYSARGKHVALLDVFLLSAGYVLRVLMGVALVERPPSNWLILCSSALALFLALAKRRADLAAAGGAGVRPSLGGYTLGFAEHAMSIFAGLSVISYAMYCMESRVLIEGREFASLPFAVYGVLHYQRLVLVHQEGGEPVSAILASPTLLACTAAWALAVTWSLGLL